MSRTSASVLAAVAAMLVCATALAENRSRPVPSFSELDTNNDGFLQESEVGYEFRDIDRDRDERIDREEYFQYLRRALRRD